MPGIVPALALVVALSSHSAGAAGVRMTLRATFELQCGWPGPAIAIVFPVGERLPTRFRPGAVLIDGKRPASVSRSGRTVTLRIARPGGVMCDSIGPGRVDVTVSGLGNPASPGRYVVHATHGTSTASTSFAVH